MLVVFTGGVKNFDHIGRLPFEICFKARTKISAVITAKRFLQMSLCCPTRALKALLQNGCPSGDVFAGMEHGFIVQTKMCQVFLVDLHQPHAEIASFPMQLVGGGNGFAQRFRLLFKRAADYTNYKRVKLALHPRHRLQGIGMYRAAALLG